jgi:outer membrane protein assembly factor BamD (BamD/ComL family)
MLKIAELRQKDYQYDEAVEVYASLMAKYPLCNEAKIAVYRQAKARMWLARRLAYNTPRCVDTLNYLKMMISKYPELPETEEMKGWMAELSAYLEKDAYEEALFYDTKQRTRHAAIEAWKRYLEDHPESVHAEKIKARIAELENTAVKTTTSNKGE